MLPIKADTEPHYVGVNLLRVEGSGCRGKVEVSYAWHLCAYARDDFVPRGYLCRSMRGVRRVRIGKVRIYTFKHYALIRANKRISILYLAWRNAVPVHAGVHFEMDGNGSAGERCKTSQVLHADDAERHIREPAFEHRFDGGVPDNEYGGSYALVAEDERFKIR